MAAVGYGVLSFIYTNYTLKTKLDNEKINIDESNSDNTHYELLNAVSEGPLITDV